MNWAAKHKDPYMMLGGELKFVRESFDYYKTCAAEYRFEADLDHVNALPETHG